MFPQNTMTNWSRTLVVGIIGIFFLAVTRRYTEACNEAICASVVSKCMLTQSCKCDLVTCTCCKECFSCLSYLYDECCSCVGKPPAFLRYPREPTVLYFKTFPPIARRPLPQAKHHGQPIE